MRGYALVSGLVVSAVMAACATDPVTEVPVADPKPTPERAFFDAEVLPIMSETCADCHANTADDWGAPEFLGLDKATYYDALTKNTSFVSCDIGNSILLLKGADPSHVGGALTTEQSERVRAWLNLEIIARFNGSCGGGTTTATTTTTTTTGAGAGGGGVGGGGVGGGGEGGAPPVAWPPTTGQMAMEEFGKCMSLTDWIETGMPDIANQNCEYQNNNLQCYNCHNNPNEGALHLPDPNAANAALEVEASFEQMRHMYSSFAIVRWTVNIEDGSYKELVSSYRLRDKGLSLNHPTYVLSDARVAAYELFMERTMAKFEAGPCLPEAEPPPEP